MSYAIYYGTGVERDISRLPKRVLLSVDDAIQSLVNEPRPPGCKKLSGNTKLYRIRVGDWRIVYEIDDTKRFVVIQIVAHRRDVYRHL